MCGRRLDGAGHFSRWIMVMGTWGFILLFSLLRYIFEIFVMKRFEDGKGGGEAAADLQIQKGPWAEEKEKGLAYGSLPLGTISPGSSTPTLQAPLPHLHTPTHHSFIWPPTLRPLT